MKFVVTHSDISKREVREEIEIHTLNDILFLSKQEGFPVIVFPPTDDSELPTLEIYDGHRE